MYDSKATIKFIGIGNIGYRAIDKMIENNLEYIEFCKINTKEKQDLSVLLNNVSLVFIVADTEDDINANIAIEIAKMAKQKHILTFAFLSNKTKQIIKNIDSYMILNFQSDSWFNNIFLIIKCIVCSMLEKKLICSVEFNDIKKIIKNSGQTKVLYSSGGTDSAYSGATILKTVVDKKIISKAKNIMFYFVGSYDIALRQIDETAKYLKSIMPKNATLVFGAAIVGNLEKEIQITMLVIEDKD